MRALADACRPGRTGECRARTSHRELHGVHDIDRAQHQQLEERHGHLLRHVLLRRKRGRLKKDAHPCPARQCVSQRPAERRSAQTKLVPRRERARARTAPPPRR